MGLETATYIHELNTSNPVGGDLISAGDDHIRLLKSTIKATFPNISGAVTATHTELSRVAGVTGGIQGQLDGKAALLHTHLESSIEDGAIFPRLGATETITGSWNFTTRPTINSASVLDANSSLLESNITDGTILARLASNETVTGSWNFTTPPLINSLGVWRWNTSGLTSGRITLATTAPVGTGTPGDIVLVYQ